AVAALPVDDAGSRFARVGAARPRNAPVAWAGIGLWPRSVVLLFASHSADSWVGRPVCLRPLWPCGMAFYKSTARRSASDTCGLRLQFAGCLSDLGWRDRGAVSGLPMVRGSEAA